MRTKKKDSKTLDKYLIFCFTFLVLYTIAHTVIFAMTGNEAGVLDALVYGVFFGEITQCFLIKRFKLQEEYKIIKGKKNEFDDSVDDM